MYSVGSAEWIHTISDKALSSSPQTSVTLTEAIWVFEEGALCVRTAFLWKRMWVIHGACQAEKYISHLHVCERERDRDWAWWCLNVFECFIMPECYESVSVCMSRGQYWHCTKYSLNALQIYQLQIIVSIHITATLRYRKLLLYISKEVLFSVKLIRN